MINLADIDSLLTSIRSFAGLVQQSDNPELLRAVLDAQNHAIELQAKFVALIAEHQALKQRLATAEQLTFRDNAYWKAEEGPFCSRCWEATDRLIHMHVRQGYLPWCPNCGKSAPDPNAAPPQRRPPARSSYIDRER